MEAPAGVGFSYSNNQNDYNTNDTKTAQDNYQFLLNWFAAYPEYSKNQFFITGESYGEWDSATVYFHRAPSYNHIITNPQHVY